MEVKDFRDELQRQFTGDYTAYNGSCKVVEHGMHMGHNWYIVAGKVCPLAYVEAKDNEFPNVKSEVTFEDTSHELLPELPYGWRYLGYDFGHCDDFIIQYSGLSIGKIWSNTEIKNLLIDGLDDIEVTEEDNGDWDYTNKMNVLVNIGILANDLQEIAEGMDRGALWDMNLREYGDLKKSIESIKRSVAMLENKAEER